MSVLHLWTRHQPISYQYHNHNHPEKLCLLLGIDEAEHVLGYALLKVTRAVLLCMVSILASIFDEAEHTCRRLVVVLIHVSGLVDTGGKYWVLLLFVLCPITIYHSFMLVCRINIFQCLAKYACQSRFLRLLVYGRYSGTSVHHIHYMLVTSLLQGNSTW